MVEEEECEMWKEMGCGDFWPLPQDLVHVVMNYFCGDAEGVITVFLLGASFQTHCGGGCTLRVNKAGLWPKGCLFESED